MHRLHRVRYWLWLRDDWPPTARVLGILDAAGFHDLGCLERGEYGVYGPWRLQIVTRNSIVRGCEEVRRVVEPSGGYLVDVEVLWNGRSPRRLPKGRTWEERHAALLRAKRRILGPCSTTEPD